MAGQKQNLSPKGGIFNKQFIQRTFKLEDI